MILKPISYLTQTFCLLPAIHIVRPLCVPFPTCCPMRTSAVVNALSRVLLSLRPRFTGWKAHPPHSGFRTYQLLTCSTMCGSNLIQALPGLCHPQQGSLARIYHNDQAVVIAFLLGRLPLSLILYIPKGNLNLDSWTLDSCVSYPVWPAWHTQLLFPDWALPGKEVPGIMFHRILMVQAGCWETPDHPKETSASLGVGE